ncbi:MAG: chromosome segregation protein SMC [bacterium]
MYLKSLKIHGFKSFAHKTHFVFKDGITSIVGPNGCGKSNIVDAIRWVLGEQKAGIIRSERMENVIFNGTKTAKPLGMAEVSMTIKNTKNVLPIEYSEVVITRRLFRSSESQYLLNNTPCRLKDIQDLFMDTGMGPDAYSIIELNMVETMLNGKPEERRRIFEEAAGVTKYKLRRKAAFRKLEATEADLVRLNDIISEVEKNVNSLQRQVKKAQRYQEIKEKLKQDEVAYATNQFSKIKAELEPLQDKLRETQDNRVSLTTKFDEHEAEIEEARRALLDLERKLSDEQKKLNELSQKIHKKEEDILVGRERRKAIETAKSRLHKDKEDVEARRDKNKKLVVEAQETLQQLFSEIQIAEDDNRKKGAALKSFEVRIREKYEALKAIENQRVQAADGLTESKQETERIKTQLENVEERTKAINNELEELALLEKVRKEKMARLLLNQADKNAQLTEQQQQLKRLQEELQSQRDAKDSLREKILNRTGEVQTLKERIALLKKFIESYEDHPEGVQHLLLSGHLNGGCKGTLADNMTVDSTYRRAIETAMGEAAVSLIVEATDQALECIEILKEHQKGSVTFFPLDKFASSRARVDLASKHGDILKANGVIDWAHNLVKCDSRYQSIVHALLSEYLIVENLQIAKRQADSLRGTRVNLITLNGEVVSSWGPIKGGSNGTPSAGVIGRRALIEELEVKLRDELQQLEADEKERDGIEVVYQKTLSREQDLQTKLKGTESEITELEVELAQLSFESQKDAQSRERLHQENASQKEAEKSLQQKMQTISPSLDHLLENKMKFESDLEDVNSELESLENQIEEYRTNEQDSRMKLADLKSEEKHLQDNIAKMHEFERELQDSLKRIEEEISTAIKESEELENEIEQNKGAITADFDQHKILESNVHSIEQSYLEQKEELDRKEKFAKGIRDEKDMVSEALHAMELRVSELKMNADKIRERIKEEYAVAIKKGPIDESFDEETVLQRINQHKNRLESMGPVNLLALKEFDKEKSRLEFLTTQKNDLLEAEANLNETIKVINKTAREQFSQVFEQVKENFSKVFSGFFENGHASLKLAPNEDPLEAEILIEASPKGRRTTALTLLSGGEKALTAISILFAIYLVKPSPFCILDEVDAPLDDSNVGRFLNALRNFSSDTQFLVVTHNKLTMRAADCLYGVTMEDEGISKVVSVNFQDMELKHSPKAA